MPGIKYKGKDGEWHLLNQVMVNEVNVVQTTGTSSADVMSQSAVTEAIDDITPESLGNGIGTCETSAETIAKEVDIEGYKITQNGFVSITFENDVPSGATLNINNQGAKPIYHKGAPIEDDVISSGDTVMFGYDGSHYVVSSLGGGSTSNPNETVSISLAQVNGNSGDLFGAAITITDDDSQTTLLSTTWQGSTITTEIDVNTNYTVSVETIAGYSHPSPQSYHADFQNKRNIGFLYSALGVYIEATDGTLYTSSTWASAGKTSNAVVVIADACKVRMALTETSLMYHDDSADSIASYLLAKGNEILAKADYDGEGNTAKIIQFNSDNGTNTTSYAAPYCNAFLFTFPSGQKGYLPALGQLWTIYQNKTNVDACLTACGGTAFTSSSYRTAYASSTYKGLGGDNYARMWTLRGDSGYVDYEGLASFTLKIRPCSTYE